ncbi:MAG TPA: DUF2807 domain-containing protein [Dehalococcoidales bacterium]|nr:DUF2807 domain-containing protein [Dehalococcoidales bacterium]
MQTKEFEITGFTEVEVVSAFQIEISKGDKFSVSIDADNFHYIKAEKNGETLVIGRQGIEWLAPFHSQPRARVAMPLLKRIDLSQASRGKIEGFDSNENLNIKISEASHLDARHIAAGELQVEVSGAAGLDGEMKVTGNARLNASGASSIVLTGSAADIKVKANGASRVELDRFAVQNASVDLSGASNGSVNLNGKLDARASGASNLTWVGNPTMGEIMTSGASNLRRK